MSGEFPEISKSEADIDIAGSIEVMVSLGISPKKLADEISFWSSSRERMDDEQELLWRVAIDEIKRLSQLSPEDLAACTAHVPAQEVVSQSLFDVWAQEMQPQASLDVARILGENPDPWISEYLGALGAQLDSHQETAPFLRAISDQVTPGLTDEDRLIRRLEREIGKLEGE